MASRDQKNKDPQVLEHEYDGIQEYDNPMPRWWLMTFAGTIIFSGSRRGSLLRVSANGGVPSPVTTLDGGRGEQSHRWPQFLPDGEHFLYWATDNEAQVQDAIRIGSQLLTFRSRTGDSTETQVDPTR